MNKKYEHIRAVVIKMIIQQGIDKISMDEIADQAAVSKVTIYKYYKDKEQLYLTVGTYLLESYMTNMIRAVDVATDIFDKMSAVVDIYSDFISSEYLWACNEVAKYYNDFYDVIDIFEGRRKEVINKIINQGIVAGLIRKDVPADYLLHYIDMGFTYFQHNEAYRNQITKDQTFKQGFMTFILSNILVEEQ